MQRYVYSIPLHNDSPLFLENYQESILLCSQICILETVRLNEAGQDLVGDSLQPCTL